MKISTTNIFIREIDEEKEKMIYSLIKLKNSIYIDML